MGLGLGSQGWGSGEGWGARLAQRLDHLGDGGAVDLDQEQHEAHAHVTAHARDNKVGQLLGVRVRVRVRVRIRVRVRVRVRVS